MTTSAFNPIPSDGVTRAVTVSVTSQAPTEVTVLAVPVASTGDLPGAVGLDRDALKRIGFKAGAGQHIVLPRESGPDLVLVGLGEADDVGIACLRDAAAVAARAVPTDVGVALDLRGFTALDEAELAAAAVEGAVLGRYTYEEMRSEQKAIALEQIVLIVSESDVDAARAGADRGLILARGAALSRDLANAPADYLTAPVLGDLALRIAQTSGLDVTVHDKAALEAMGCGALLGVNAGSTTEPRMIVLKYTPKAQSTGHLGLVGKGIMYDSGGLSLKPSNDMHAAMKMDMSGAGAVLAAMSILADLEVPVTVSAYLACTDNMPSGSATKLGDVLVSRSGRTIEVMNTDAEGRLVLADAIALANEDDVDAIVDIATLTGAALMALGPSTAAVLGNDDEILTQVEVAAELTDERVWQLPLDARYRPWLDSDIADIKNIGGSYAGSITAALFLSEWVGDTPWAHLDIAGPMRSESVDAWRTKGATGFGARLLAEFAANFAAPQK